MMLLSTVTASAGPIPVGTLTFTTPTGVIGPTDVAQVWVTLSLEPGTGSLETDSSGNVVGLTFDDFQSYLFEPTTYQEYYDTNTPTQFRSNINVSFQCSGTFTSTCTDGPPYTFQFAFNGPSEPLAMTWPADLMLADGSITDYLFGVFVPTNGGPVAPGTYSFPVTSVFIQVYDDNFTGGDPFDPSHIADIPIASTFGETPFQRTVSGASVPDPGSSMMLLGLGLAGLAAGRRRFR
jgi:hypothetical protein